MAEMLTETQTGRSNDAVSSSAVKGKRTKRTRPPSPLPASAASTSQHSSAESTCTEEEDMANCLILLARGGGGTPPPPPPAVDERGLLVYQCKTCDRCFNSFQALGGHRASHKKPRNAGGEGEEENRSNNDGAVTVTVAKSVISDPSKELDLSLGIVIPAAAVAAGKVGKVHECSICGAGFSSGQALGGHMRRHRTVVPTAAAATVGSGVMGLDLNLPAPEDDVEGRGQNKFRFVFSSPPPSAGSTLVDCHF